MIGCQRNGATSRRPEEQQAKNRCAGGTPAPQVGSQHRSKAEPAGAVINGKWVASKPSAEQMTLQGEPLRRAVGRLLVLPAGLPGWG